MRFRVLLLTALAAPVFSQTALQLHTPLTRESAPARIETFTLAATSGNYVHLAIRKQGVDVTLTVTSPTGAELLKVNSPNAAFGPEPISFLADRSGPYQITVAKSPATGETGKYEIEWTAHRPPTPRDTQQIEAERLLAQAASADRRGTRDSFTQAIDLYNQSEAIWRALGDAPEQGLCLQRIGRAYYVTGDGQQALQFLDQSLQIRRASADRAGEETTLNNLGAAYDGLGQRQRALDYFNQALPIARALGDRSGEASALANIAIVYSALGDNRKALENDTQALALVRAVNDRAREAGLLNNVAFLYEDLGEKQKALDAFNQALPLRRAVGDRAGEAATLSGIGNVYLGLGEKQQALDSYTQALPILRAAGNRTAEAGTLNNIGMAFNELGDRQQALDYFNQALVIQRAAHDPSGEAGTLDNIGVVYRRLGDNQKALLYYQRALDLRRALGDRHGEANAVNNIATIYASLGDKQQALAFYNQGLPIERAIGDRSGEATTLDNLRELLANSAPALAVTFGKQAVNVLQSIRRDNRTLDTQLRQSYEKSIEPTYRNLAALLIKLSRFAEAEEVLNRLKDKEAADYIRRDSIADQLRPATLLPAEAAALKRYDEIVDNVVQLGQRKADLLAKRKQSALTPADLAESQHLDADLAAANTVLNTYLAEQQQSFAPNSLAAKQVTDLKQAESVQSSLQKLGPNAVAIYTLTAADQYIAMLVTPGARKAYSTKISQADLNQKLFAFRQTLQNPASNPLPLAQELYKILLPEGLPADLAALEQSGPVTIMWSLDGTLRYIPIAALHDGQHYLVERFRNSLITPESLASLTDANASDLHGAGFGVSQAHEGFSALPSVPEELHRIFPTLIPGPTRLDADFNKDTFQSGLTASVKPIVHIATHFDAEPGVAANSSLLLGDGTKLSLAEIEAGTRLFDGVDLLTLSACSTAFQSGTADGREVDSLGIIAQRLGAKGVIASLWNVSDQATATLMQTLYQNWKQHPAQGKGEALRRAQSDMATGVLRPDPQSQTSRSVTVPNANPQAKDWTHPYYWAPFILIGNWK